LTFLKCNILVLIQMSKEELLLEDKFGLVALEFSLDTIMTSRKLKRLSLRMVGSGVEMLE